MSKLDILCNQFNKQFKEDIASRGIPVKYFEKIPFSSPLANYMIYGGIPRGRIIEFAGEENGRQNYNSTRHSSKCTKVI